MSTPPQPKPTTAQKMLAERQQLPGMLPEEIAIFRAWWLTNGTKYTSVDYNVRVGKGYDPGPTVPDEQRRNAILNTKRRVDALLWLGEQPVIVEVKRRATIMVVGQVLSYQLLWNRDNPSRMYPLPLVLCNQIDDDTRYVLGHLSIPYVIVNADLSGIKVSK